MQFSEAYMTWAQECIQKYEANKEAWEAKCLEHAFKAGWEQGGWMIIHGDTNPYTVCRVTFPPIPKETPSHYVIQWYQNYYHYRQWNQFLHKDWKEISMNCVQESWEVYATCDNIPLLLTMASRFGGQITFWNDAYYSRPPMPIPAHEPPTGDQIGGN